jgi:hypothetical protein
VTSSDATFSSETSPSFIPSSSFITTSESVSTASDASSGVYQATPQSTVPATSLTITQASSDTYSILSSVIGTSIFTPSSVASTSAPEVASIAATSVADATTLAVSSSLMPSSSFIAASEAVSSSDSYQYTSSQETVATASSTTASKSMFGAIPKEIPFRLPLPEEKSTALVAVTHIADTPTSEETEVGGEDQQQFDALKYWYWETYFPETPVVTTPPTSTPMPTPAASPTTSSTSKPEVTATSIPTIKRLNPGEEIKKEDLASKNSFFKELKSLYSYIEGYEKSWFKIFTRKHSADEVIAETERRLKKVFASSLLRVVPFSDAEIKQIEEYKRNIDFTLEKYKKYFKTPVSKDNQTETENQILISKQTAFGNQSITGALTAGLNKIAPFANFFAKAVAYRSLMSRKWRWFALFKGISVAIEAAQGEENIVSSIFKGINLLTVAAEDFDAIRSSPPNPPRMRINNIVRGATGIYSHDMGYKLERINNVVRGATGILGELTSNNHNWYRIGENVVYIGLAVVGLDGGPLFSIVEPSFFVLDITHFFIHKNFFGNGSIEDLNEASDTLVSGLIAELHMDQHMLNRYTTNFLSSDDRGGRYTIRLNRAYMEEGILKGLSLVSSQRLPFNMSVDDMFGWAANTTGLPKTTLIKAVTGMVNTANVITALKMVIKIDKATDTIISKLRTSSRTAKQYNQRKKQFQEELTEVEQYFGGWSHTEGDRTPEQKEFIEEFVVIFKEEGRDPGGRYMALCGRVNRQCMKNGQVQDNAIAPQDKQPIERMLQIAQDASAVELVSLRG